MPVADDVRRQTQRTPTTPLHAMGAARLDALASNALAVGSATALNSGQRLLPAVVSLNRLIPTAAIWKGTARDAIQIQ
jgi:hypothetical protein